MQRDRRGACLAPDQGVRTTLLLPLLATLVACGSDALEPTAYRRLVDTFDSEAQCLSDGALAPCYQTLTFCSNGRARAQLEQPAEGRYHIDDGELAVIELPRVTVQFDLATASSPQLPGRHAWELALPLQYDCP